MTKIKMKTSFFLFFLAILNAGLYAEGAYDIGVMPDTIKVIDDHNAEVLRASALTTQKYGFMEISIYTEDFTHGYYSLDGANYNRNHEALSAEDLAGLDGSGSSVVGFIEGFSSDEVGVTLSQETKTATGDLDPLALEECLKIGIPLDGGSRDISFTLYNETSGKLVTVMAEDFTSEFFPGENAFFAQHPSGAERELEAAAFIYAGLSLKDDTSSDAFKLSFDGLDVPWSAYTGLAENKDEDFVKAFLLMYMAINRNLRVGELDPVSSLTTTSMTEDQFSSIYCEQANPYIKAYLRYFATGGLSLFYEEMMGELTEDDLDYSPSNYRPLSGEEGVKLAESARQFLTGAVEYTLFQEHRQPEVNDIFNDNRSLIELWASDLALTTGARANNYLPEGSTWPDNGNPLPYSPAGIDTPRTFNYKMLEQAKTQEDAGKIVETTRAISPIGENFFQGYISELTLVNNDTGSRQTYNPVTGEISNYPWTTNSVRPFLPGYIAPDIDGYAELGNSMFIPDKTAGVDSAGLLLGSLSMAGFPVQSKDNTDIAELMDRYIKMNDPTLSGTDENGRPVFYPYAGQNQSNSILDNTALRLTRGDIERSTVLLPSLEYLRTGDLLVSANTYGEMEIAIVTEKNPTTETSLEAIMESVKIITVNIDTGYVKEGFWTDGTTLNRLVESYQPRRLVVVGEEEDKSRGNNGLLFNTLVNVVATLMNNDTDIEDLHLTVKLSDCFDLTYKIDPLYDDDFRHWVPNTEIAEDVPNRGNPFKVKFDLIPNENYSLVDSESIPAESSLCDYGILNITGKDLNYDSAKISDTSNIYNNSDTVEFMLTSLFTEMKDVYTFNKNSSNPEIFHSESEQGIDLYISENLELEAKDSNGNRTRCFAVRSRNGIPGDNIYLSFSAVHEVVNDDGTTSSDYLETASIADQSNFFTLYDHKMLWRANLYVDEREDDWNNLHPWTGANGNLWDVGNIHPGTQKTILEWTRFNDNETINNAVAYGWGCNDDFDEFNSELLGQFDASKQYHQAVVDTYCSANGVTQEALDIDAVPETVKFSLQYLSSIPYEGYFITTAPDNKWDNYISPSREVKKNPFVYWYYLDQLSKEELDDPLNEQRKYYINDVIYSSNNDYISIPGFSTFHGYCDDDERNPIIMDPNNTTVPLAPVNPNDRNYESNQTNASAGVDCSGLVERAADYPDNPYFVGKDDTKPATGSFDDADKTWLIASNGKATSLHLLNTLVPGDILVWAGSHVMIVQDIQYPNGERVISDLSQITVIQASRGEVLAVTDNSGNITTFTSEDFIWKTNISNANYSENYEFRRLGRD